MFSNLWSVVGFLAWCEKHNRTPVVDFTGERPSNLWSSSSKRNPWTDYFMPVSKVSLKEAGWGEIFEGRPTEFPVLDYSVAPGYAQTFKRFIKLNQETSAFIDPWVRAVASLDYPLGVHLRGTDMKIAKSHPAPPTDFQVKTAVDRALGMKPFKEILVATEDARALAMMRRRYGARVLTTDSFRTSRPKKLVHLEASIPQYRYFLGLQVLRDAWVLAHCKGLVSGHSNVSEHVQVITPNPFLVNLQIRRLRVDVMGSSRVAIRVTNFLREISIARWEGRDFRIVDRSA